MANSHNGLSIEKCATILAKEIPPGIVKFYDTRLTEIATADESALMLRNFVTIRSGLGKCLERKWRIAVGKEFNIEPNEVTEEVPVCPDEWRRRLESSEDIPLSASAAYVLIHHLDERTKILDIPRIRRDARNISDVLPRKNRPTENMDFDQRLIFSDLVECMSELREQGNNVEPFERRWNQIMSQNQRLLTGNCRILSAILSAHSLAQEKRMTPNHAEKLKELVRMGCENANSNQDYCDGGFLAKMLNTAAQMGITGSDVKACVLATCKRATEDRNHFPEKEIPNIAWSSGVLSALGDYRDNEAVQAFIRESTTRVPEQYSQTTQLYHACLYTSAPIPPDLQKAMREFDENYSQSSSSMAERRILEAIDGIPGIPQSVNDFHIDGFQMDKYFPGKLINVEIDGILHEQRRHIDDLRDTALFSNRNIRVLRISDSENVDLQKFCAENRLLSIS